MNPQTPPVHVEVPCAGAAHGEHDVPQLAGDVSAAHVAPHMWNPVLHVAPHDPPAQTATPFVGAGHTVVQSPQWFTSVFVSTHDIEQRVGVAPVQPLVHAIVVPELEHSGVGSAQAVVHDPQWVG